MSSAIPFKVYPDLPQIPLQPASLDIWDKKYRLKTKDGTVVDENVDDTYRRVARALSDVEATPEKKAYWYDRFVWALFRGAIPAGRITSNAGALEHKPATSTINCTVSDTIPDSMQGILDKVHEAGMTLKAGCGIGYEFSTLRPRGAFVAGAGAYTSGPMSFMDIYDKMCFTVASAGNRRGAQMGTFDISHPDVKDFILAKRENGRLRQFNLSLLITDEFMDAVAKNADWPLVFPYNRKEQAEVFLQDAAGNVVWREWPVNTRYITNDQGLVACKIYGSIKAERLWDMIMSSTYDFAEPGFILIDKVNEMNNNWWCENIRATNPCVTGDTVVLTDRGYHRIDSLVGQQVNVWNGFEFSTTIPRVTGLYQQIYDMEFSDGSKLPCTPYHNFELADGSRIEAKDLTSEHKLAKFGFPVIQGNVAVERRLAYTQGFYSGDGQKDTSRIWLYEDKCDLVQHMSVSACSNQSGSSRNRRMMATMDQYPQDKDFIPDNQFTIQTRLDWLAGLIDSDGTVSDDGVIQIWSVNREFLAKLKMMLNTLGVPSMINAGSPAGSKNLPDGRGGYKSYNVQQCWRIGLSASTVVQLRELGLTTHRVSLDYTPQRNASRFLTLTSKFLRDKLEPKVYCFTESLRHTGVFNGIMTGQCGEQPLPPYGACLLGSVDLTKFVTNPFTAEAAFDWSEYREVVTVFTRMLDNVVEINGLPLEQQRAEITRKRRHGMGFLGLGTAMTMLRMKYGEPLALQFTGDVSRVMAHAGWQAGLELATEKGPAPIMLETFQVTAEMLHKRPEMVKDGYQIGDSISGRELFAKYSRYMQKIAEIDPELVNKLRYVGSRFTHHSSIAPTGTISLSLANNASNGIEPSFAHLYSRNVIREGKKSKEKVDVLSLELLAYRLLVNPDADPYATEGPNVLPDYFLSADTITPEQHVDVQAAAQIWIDSSISKTANVPTDYPYDKFKDIYRYAHEKGLKGCTTFRYNPAAFQGVLVKESDLENTTYRFELEDGTFVDARGNEEIFYDGESHTAANLYDAIKEGYFGKF